MKNLIRFVVLCLLGWGSAFAQSNLPACQGVDVSRWRNCFGTVAFSDGGMFVGEVKDGNNRSGKGIYTYANGDKYICDFSYGNRNGQGTLYAPNGSIINQGIWADNNFVRSAPAQQASTPSSAFAQSTLPTCQGSDTSRWRNCFGTAAFPDGTKYIGEFKDGNRNGQGTYTYPDGRKYVGEFKDDNTNGQGTLTSPSGEKYVGEFKDGKLNGQGTYTYPDGSKHVGEYKNGKKNGQGTLTFPDGRKYVGEFKDDKSNGQGTRYAPNGSIVNQGFFADDTFVRFAPVQQAAIPNREIERLRAEAEEAKRKQAEAQAELRLAQQQATQTTSTAPTTTPSAIPTGKRVALVVGNKNYKVRPLANPLNDADDMSRSLRTSGFEVIDLRDATLQQMRSAVRQFGDKLLRSDVGLVYYSGHGVEVKGRNYFIPVNADIQREDEM